MKPGYTPKTLEGKLLWLGEESSELAQAISKTLRFACEKRLTARQALHLYNPDVPVEERETNHAWILRELDDLRAAVALLDSTPIPCVSGEIDCGYQASKVFTFTCPRCKKLRCYCHGSDGHNDCTTCWNNRKTSRAQKKSKSKTSSSLPEKKRAPARKQSAGGSARPRRE